MTLIRPLGPHYRAIPDITGTDVDLIKDFMMKDLEIRNYSSEDLLNEIREMKKTASAFNLDILTNYYDVFDTVRRDHPNVIARVK